jgi:uncharacterized protein YycO
MFVVYDPKSYKLKGKDFSAVLDVVEKYDVLLRRYDAYLDTHFIPGYWNHAGIHMGHRGDRNGIVVHAVAEGVIEETLFDFCKTDHLIVLRPKFNFMRSLVCERVFGAVGKEYDFNFDFKCEDRYSCTELIGAVFKDFEHGIKTSQSLGKSIIAPDSIVEANFSNILEIRK